MEHMDVKNIDTDTKETEEKSLTTEKKTNKKFLLLSVLGIIFVVIGHSGDVHIFFSNVFPFYSFHMALFAFISGYFFKDKNIIDFLKHKTKKLILTYLLWNLIYGIIINIFKNINLINYGGNLTLYNIFIAPFWSDSNQFAFNVAAWFVLAIYFVQLIYFLLNRIINKLFKLNTEIIVTVISIIIAIIELNMIMNKGITSNIRFILTRVVFLMPFYAIGQIYKKVEKYDKLNNIVYFGIILLIQLVLLQKFGNIKYNLNVLTFKYNYIVYFVASMTGIMFWLRISAIFEKFFAENKIVNYIGNNTYTIMMHHVFMIFMVNLLIYIINTTTGLLGKISVNTFKRQVWYSYDQSNPVIGIIYIVVAISIPLLIKYFIFDKIKLKLENKRRQIV